MNYRVLLMAAAILTPTLAYTQASKWVDESGTVHDGARATDEQKLPSSSLDGTWKIVQMGRVQEDGNSSWEFHNGRFTQVFDGSRLASDQYTVQGNTIKLDYGKIVVNSNDGKTMKATLGGFDYILVKASDTVDRTPKPKKELPPELKKQAQGFAEGLLSNVDMSATLDCPKAVKNTHDSADSMIGMVEKNHLDGYVEKAQYEQAVKGIREASSQITASDCQGAQGKKRDFYQCMSSNKNLFAACAKAHKF